MPASSTAQSLNEDAGISPLLLEEADRITEVLTFMSQKGFSFHTFLNAFLDNPTSRIRRKAVRFTGKGGGFITFISKVLEIQLTKPYKTSKKALAPADLTPDHATSFDIEAIYRYYKLVAPVLHKVVSAVCLVNPQTGMDIEGEEDDPKLEDPETMNSKQAEKISKKEIIFTSIK
ncbi:hypothetical protein BDZ91DRAFT_801935 [Kalaharituber pfeilii]|nr:hypothetical protein BDZ91DRAFT_801935 [Kalaharituber pfeilii]